MKEREREKERERAFSLPPTPAEQCTLKYGSDEPISTCDNMLYTICSSYIQLVIGTNGQWSAENV